MNRRTYLAGAVGALAGIAGCSNPLGGDGSGSSDDRTPAEIVQVFYEAASEGDTETAQDLFHSNVQMPPPTESDVAEFQQSSAELESTTVVEEGDGRAVVRATVSAEHPRREERVERQQPYELRRDGGAWRIYDQPLPGGGGPSAPSVQWDSSEDTESGGVSAVVFTHGGGDDLDSGSLRVRIGSETFDVPAADEPLRVASTVTVPFENGGTAVAAADDVDLVWVEDGDSTTLTSHTLTDQTTGAPSDVQIRV